ncbi:hypothetical protein I4U23_016185 [Adineta vaga]|nr:hypothetical protein I4U23_016185 [Adineta vaga]
MSSLKNYFLNLNFFASKPDSNEQESDQQRRCNIIGTRIYILLFLLILCRIDISLSLMTQITKITIAKPTKEQIIILQSKVTAYNQEDGLECACTNAVCNKTSSGIHDVFQAPLPSDGGNLIFYIPGISSGCLPVTSILVSTLECFYDRNCINRLLSYFRTNEKFKVIPTFHQSIYNPQSTIQSVVVNLMVENWIINISYEKYYSQCAPSSCTYLKISRYNFYFIINKLISLLASLILILGLIIPFAIKFIQQLKDRIPKSKIPFSLRLQQTENLVQKQLIELNLFKHYPSSHRQIRYQ